jgi:hypothetical protein
MLPVDPGIGRAQNHNNLIGSASIVGAPFGVANQSWSNSAWALQALVGTGASTPEGPVDPPPMNLNGISTEFLVLNGKSTTDVDGNVITPGAFAACPSRLLGTFTTPGAPDEPAEPLGSTTGGAVNITLVSCTQDMTRNAKSSITKYVYTFWNEDEEIRTGFFECADTWHETSLNTALVQYASLHTNAVSMRIDSVADTTVCGPSAQRVGFVGVISQTGAGGYARGRNLIGDSVNPDGVVSFETPVIDF